MSARTRSSEIRGIHVLGAMLGFFGVIIAINVAFSVIAVRSFPGEDIKRSYLQGLRYNEVLAERAREAELGWRAGAGFARGTGDAIVEVRIVDRGDAPIAGLAVTGRLRRPATTRDDVTLTFEEAGPGLYRAFAGQLEQGAWALDAHAEDGGRSFSFERRLMWSTR